MDTDGLTRTHAENQAVDRFVAMGTRIECHLFGGHDLADAAAALRTVIEAVDDALTIHRISPATILNDRLRSDGRAAIDDPILWSALLLCDELRALTDGLFDPTAGMADAGWSAIEIDRTERRIRAEHPTAVDFGGVGKGIALDSCRRILIDAQVASALVSLGESSILAHGEHPLGGDWLLAVPHPLRPDAPLVELSVRDRCLSISSTIGSANGDTIDPLSGKPVSAPMTAIAIDASGAWAEAFSTALMVASPEQRNAISQAARCEALHFFHHQNDGGQHDPSAPGEPKHA